MSEKKSRKAEPSDNGPPAPAKAAVIRRLEGAEETSHERLVKKHLPAWVVSGAVHVAVIGLALVIFGRGGKDAGATDKILTTSVEKEPEEPVKDLTNEDPGLQSDLSAALPEIDRLDEKNADFAVTNDPIGLPSTNDNDPNFAAAPPGLAPSDLPNPGVTGTEGAFMKGDGGAGGLLNSGFVGRSGATKSKLLKEGGGNEESERAVALGLAWLARQQRADGSWVYDGSDKTDITAATGMGLLPFLAAGETHKYGKKYQKNVLAGLNWLIRNLQSSGKFNNSGNMYSQAIGTLALCEAYGMTKDKSLLFGPAQAAINFIQNAQGADGSWGYQAGTTGDTSIVGWQIQALKAAQLGKDLVVKDAVIKKAIDFLDKVGGGSRKAAYGYNTSAGAAPGTALTSVGLLCRYYVSGWGPNNAGMAEGVEGLLKRNPPRPGGQLDMYYFYYATQVVHFFEGEEWKTWNEGPVKDGKRSGGMRDWLISLQVKGAAGPNVGSWDPDATWIGRSCGRMGTTAMALLTLEVYYRHLPLYKRTGDGMKVLDAVK